MRQRGEIETIAADPRAVSGQRHARLTFAGALRLELPAACAFLVSDGNPQVVSLSGCLSDLRNLVAIKDGRRHARSPFSSASLTSAEVPRKGRDASRRDLSGSRRIPRRRNLLA